MTDDELWEHHAKDRVAGMNLAVRKMRELGKDTHGCVVGKDCVSWRVHEIQPAGEPVKWVWEVRVTDGVATERAM